MAGIIFCSFSTVFAYSGGSGTEADPYQIGTVSDWTDLMNTPSDWDANFIMTADINLQGVPLIPVGNDLNGTYIYFRGIFDGNGHIIHNGTITGGYLSTGIGLFGRISSDSQIRNLGAKDVNMSGGGRVAGLVGCSFGTISKCFATGKVSQSPEAISTSFGGLVGKNYGTITGSNAACDVNVNRRYVGGLAGSNVGTIIDSYADGTVNGDRNVGGLVGENGLGYGPGSDDGGVPAYIGTIARCYAAGSVSGNRNVGGFAGTNGTGPEARRAGVSITDCYSTCSVTGGAGLTEISSGYITNCYAAGRVNGSGGGLIGGSVGFPFPATNSFWDIEATGQSTSASGTGLTTAEMMTLSTFTSAGWDFVNETVNGPNDVWFIREGKEYPRFVWENNRPVADAGQDQTVYAWIDGIAEATLDANNSDDADGDELSYLWKWSIDGNTYDTNGVDPTIELPVGVHTIELVVNDGFEDSEPNEVTITVVEPIKGTLQVVPRIINGRCGRRRITAIIRLPAGIRRQQIDSGKKLLLYPGEIEASYQIISRYYERRTERVVILACFDASALIDAAGSAGPVQLDVVGQLKTGQYFYGTDTVRIINPPRRPPSIWWH
jgi:hypothetical protein